MNHKYKTREALINELHDLHLEYDSLKLSYSKGLTKRKKAEEKNRVSENRYRALFNAIDEGFCIIEVIFDENEKAIDYRFLEVNPSFEKQTGFKNAQGRRMRELAPEHEDYWFEIYGEIALTGQPVRFANRAEQLHRWYDVYAFRFGQPENRQVAVLFNDITKRELGEETIKIQARLPGENPQPIMQVGRNGKLLYANEASYKLIRWKLQIGKKIPSDLQKVITNTLNEGIVKIIDLKHDQRIISFNFVPIVEKGYVNLYGQDITERIKIEEELRNSKDLLEKLNKYSTEIRENDRARISREIHDQIGQSLTILKLDLKLMQKYSSTGVEAKEKLEGMIEMVSNTIKDVQRISSDLRPGILDELGIVSAIEWYCDEFEKRTGIKCKLKLGDSDYPDSQIHLTFYRVLQEALTNVIRHAKASTVTIKLHQTQKGTTLTIIDNGIGITRQQVESVKSLGLIGMRERVRQFGGMVDFKSREGKGTELKIFIPVN